MHLSFIYCSLYLDELLPSLQSLKLSPPHCVSQAILCGVISYIILFITPSYIYLLRTLILPVVLEYIVGASLILANE